MTLYTVRTGFSVFKNGLVYTAGQSVDLTSAEFARHKHKLENTQSTVGQGISSTVNSVSAANVSFNDLAADLLPSADTGTVQAVIEEIDRRLDNFSVQSVSLPIINVETISADKQLTNSDATIQDLTNSLTTSLNILLPSSPILGKQFLLINESNSTGNFYTNNTNVLPGDRYEIVWNGFKWLEI
jgi:hypothetical protein